MIWQLTTDKTWNKLKSKFSWITDMEQVEQHKSHHAEGNVAIHTQMVINELLSNERFKQLNEQDQEILWTSALMHDIEKRSTSLDEGDGHISAKGHAKKGEKSVREILFKDIPTPFIIREQIASLVRLHGLPLWIMEKENPQKRIIEASYRTNLSHLHLLAESDACGRICADLDDLLYKLKLFELYSKELNCWENERVFETENARYTYFNTEDSYLNYIPFDSFRSKVIMLSGLPGMGKDYYIESLNLDIPIISLDAIRRKHKIRPTDKKLNGWVVQEAKEEARQYLRKGQDFIWNATNITSLMRKQLIDLFVDYNAHVTIDYIEKPYKTWRTQNRNREYPIPENVLDKMLGNLEIPQRTEAHAVKYICE